MSMKQVANIIRVKNSIDKIKENFTGEFTTADYKRFCKNKPCGETPLLKQCASIQYLMEQRLVSVRREQFMVTPTKPVVSYHIVARDGYIGVNISSTDRWDIEKIKRVLEKENPYMRLEIEETESLAPIPAVRYHYTLKGSDIDKFFERQKDKLWNSIQWRQNEIEELQKKVETMSSIYLRIQ